MTAIRALFDPDKNINRSIEKVITYQASQVERLKAEIREYIVTERIDEQLEGLLEKMQLAMDSGGGHEVGVWVSGFYGSGKSSFTKYLGLALDGRHEIDGQPFLRHLQDRVHRSTTKALLSALAQRFPAAVVMLDLASEQIAGATLAEVSTVLYHKVLQYAGYSRNIKVAAFERKLKKDGRYDDFLELFQAEVGQHWTDYQNDELVVDATLPALAHKLYPDLFRTDHAFSTASSDSIYLMDDRVQEMIEIVRDFSGRENILFVIDEIGQYVGSNSNKILDLQGLAENLKTIGGGKVWIVATAQQTLTEDDPRIAINSPELFKLKDRFPITVELESSDIREICYRRLLGKSPEGAKQLADLFDRHGAQLRHNVKLADAKGYDAALDRDGFVNLYPFLSAHFDILLHLLGALAKSTGGIGLRSAIKVVQDILVEGAGQQTPVADQQLGWLVSTATLYDALERDIRRAYAQIYAAVEKTRQQVRDDPFKLQVAKTIAILQILNNLPASVQNVAALMHPSVDAAALTDRVKTAVDELVGDPFVPLMAKDGSLRFFSEKLGDIERERAQLPVRQFETRRIFNAALRDVFDPLPSARIHGSLVVTSGLRHRLGSQAVPLAGERETVQTVISFAEPADYEDSRTLLLDESRERANGAIIYLVGRSDPRASDLTDEIYRCQQISEKHRNDPDQEVRDYCTAQNSRAEELISELQRLLARTLSQGSFLFRGRPSAVDTLDQDLGKAARMHLAEAAEQIFDRYPEAPERAGTDLAEKFLRQPNLRSITSQLDPLGLVEMASTPRIRTSHKGLVSIRDYIERNGTVEGKQLLDYFSSHPFGWSPDTLRYMIAALLRATEVKLKVAGHEVTVIGQQAIDALKTNPAFRSVGVSLRHDRPSNEVLGRAAERLTELCGEQVLPLEDEISKVARQRLPELQQRVSFLSERLRSLDLPGVEVIEAVGSQIASMLQTDASDAPQRFGAEESPLYAGLKWAIEARNAFQQDFADTVRDLRSIRAAVAELPSSGVPGQLRDDVQEALERVDACLAEREFFKHRADLATRLTELQARIADAVRAMRDAQKGRLRQAEQEVRLLPEWHEFTAEEQSGLLDRLQAMEISAAEDLVGLKRLVARQFDIDVSISDVKNKIVSEGRERLADRLKQSGGLGGGAAKEVKIFAVPKRIASHDQLDALITALQQLRAEIGYADFDVTLSD